MNIIKRFTFNRDKKERFEGMPIDWSKFLPVAEDQKYIFDENDCMSFSSTHVIETFLNYMKTQGLLPQNFLDFCTQNGYFDSTGSFAFSVRFNGIMNGTDPNKGADFEQVWDGIANYGMIPKSMLSFSMAQAQLDHGQLAEWADYYNKADVTQAMKDLANKFNQFISINYKWILSQGFLNGLWNSITGQNQTSILQNALAISPVHIALYPCPTWNTGAVKWCGNNTPSHGVELFKANSDSSMSIFDQYSPYVKILGLGYVIPYAVVPIITFKSKPVYTFKNSLSYGQTSADITELQKCLAYLGYFHLVPTGSYFNLTASAVYQFQKDYTVDTPEVLGELAGHNVGPKTIAQLNTLFSPASAV